MANDCTKGKGEVRSQNSSSWYAYRSHCELSAPLFSHEGNGAIVNSGEFTPAFRSSSCCHRRDSRRPMAKSVSNHGFVDTPMAGQEAARGEEVAG